MNRQSGFTLIEIAIVLVVVGLLLGGVLKGQELINNAKVRNTISKMDELKAAVFGFQDRYNVLPGDSSTAATVVGGVAVNCVTSCNNGQINPWRNTSLVTNHLSAAGFYTGNFATAEINAAPTTLNAPSNPWGGAMFIAFWNQFNVNGGNSSVSANGIYSGIGIPSTALAEIDRKIDDGFPQSGTFRSGWPRLATAGCVNGNAWVVTNGRSDCTGVNLY